MTKQEAIERLTAYRDMWKVNTLTRGCTESVGWVTVEAIDMAIEALSCSEEPNRSDVIKRQDAIDAIHCDITVTGRQNAELVSETIATFVDRIKALPSAQPERKKGEWILCTESVEETFHTGSRCSNCNYWKPMGIWKFCPNCGAKMN